MPDMLIVAETRSSPEMRHEAPLMIPDPFLYSEVNGKRHVAVGSGEKQRIEELGLGIEVGPLDAYGGIELTVDARYFRDRRRVKSDAELAGIRRAQYAAEAAMASILDLLRRAEARNSGLVVDGETMTCEQLTRSADEVFVENGAYADESNVGRIRGELVAGDVITIEPGLYRKGVHGVRLEDLLLVTEDGCEVLIDFPYDLEVTA